MDKSYIVSVKFFEILHLIHVHITQNREHHVRFLHVVLVLALSCFCPIGSAAVSGTPAEDCNQRCIWGSCAWAPVLGLSVLKSDVSPWEEFQVLVCGHSAVESTCKGSGAFRNQLWSLFFSSFGTSCVFSCDCSPKLRVVFGLELPLSRTCVWSYIKQT